MKKKIYLCMLLLLMIGGITGCQKADEKISSMDMQESERVETKEKAEDESKDKVEGSQPSETENSLSNTTQKVEDKTYNIEDYGTIEEKQQEYLENGTENVAYYYEMENFFFSDTLSNAASINHTLQQIYDEYEKGYIEGAAEYQSGWFDGPPMNIPYAYWHILNLTYVGDDYVSIQYNDVSYMGGAHPYSWFDGITIDCKTGEQVSASQLLGKSDEEILTEISNTMGHDGVSTWDDVDFYLTDSSIVFFYRMPGFWEDVVLKREDARGD